MSRLGRNPFEKKPESPESKKPKIAGKTAPIPAFVPVASEPSPFHPLTLWALTELPAKMFVVGVSAAALVLNALTEQSSGQK